MRVRVVGVVVVDRGPVEAPAEVPVDLRHEAPDVGRHVELVAVLRREDESELVLLAGEGLLEGVGVGGTVGAVEVALGAVALDAFALDVAQVQRRPLQAGALHLDHASLENHAARERSRGADGNAHLGGSKGAREAASRTNVREHGVAERVLCGAERIFFRIGRTGA